MILYDIYTSLKIMIHIGSHFRYSMASANFSRLTGLYVWLIQINSHMMSHTAHDNHSSGISRFVRSMQEILCEGPTYFCLLKSTLNTLSVGVLISSLLCIYRYASTDHQFGRFHSWTSHPQHHRGGYIWAEWQLCVQVFWSHSSAWVLKQLNTIGAIQSGYTLYAGIPWACTVW